MKILDIVDLCEVYKDIADMKMSISTAYKLNKILREYKEDIEFYSNKMNEIILTYSLKDENGNPITEGNTYSLDPNLIISAQNAINELNGIELKKVDIHFKLDELETLELTPKQLQPFMNFI